MVHRFFSVPSSLASITSSTTDVIDVVIDGCGEPTVALRTEGVKGDLRGPWRQVRSW
jgi:hypothetical protein